MSISATKDTSTGTWKEQARRPDWQTILFWAVIVALLAIAIAMRLYNLGLPFDRDSYDEGVYWQSLRAMGEGHALYGDIFYSQPPLFLLSTYPIYALFGASLWSARLGIAVVSLFGLAGALLLGKALGGRLGALAALLLAVVDPLFLAQSQTIQAEASSVAFSFLAMGLALYWWKYPTGRRGLLLAVLTGVTVALSIMCKLLGVALLVPVVLLMLARLWWGTVGEDGDEKRSQGQGTKAAQAPPPIIFPSRIPSRPYSVPPIPVRYGGGCGVFVDDAGVDSAVFGVVSGNVGERSFFSYRCGHGFEQQCSARSVG